MEPRVHYFVFKPSHEHCEHWVEITAINNKKAQEKMAEIYGNVWHRHFNEFNFAWHSRKYPQGCLARHEAE